MDQLLKLFQSEHDDDLLVFDLQILQGLLVVPHSLNFYTVSTVLFHKDRGGEFGVKNCMSNFSMFIPSKANVKLANGNMGHARVIGIILCCFPNCPIIYPVVPVYYCPFHPSNTISLVALKCSVCFEKFIFEPLEHCDFIYPLYHYWISPYNTRNNLDYFQIEIVKVIPQGNKYILFPTAWVLSNHNIS